MAYRILSCDGGGIRGLLTAVLLENLETQLQLIRPGSQLRDYFDIIAGTSTGSIIACGIAQGISAKGIRELYEEDGIRIFTRFNETITSLIERILTQEIDLRFWEEDRKRFFSQPVYDGEGLETVLKEHLGETTLFKELHPLTLVTSYDTYNRRAVVFKNNEAEFQDIPVWEICRASAAAPVAFPAHVTQNPTFLKALSMSQSQDATIEIPPEGIPLIDGGVVANNPTLCAIAEGLRIHNGKLPSLVASFGTGYSLSKITVAEAKGWGAFNWASLARGIPLMDVFSDGSADATDYIARQMLFHQEYIRLQPLLKEDEAVPAFSANQGNMMKLSKAANNFLASSEGKAQITKLLSALTTTKQAVAQNPST